MPTVLNDSGKLVFLLVALVGAFALVMVGAVVKDAVLVTSGVGLAGSIIGYVTGNGRLAARQEMPSPLLSSASAVALSPSEWTALGHLAKVARGAEAADAEDPIVKRARR